MNTIVAVAIVILAAVVLLLALLGLVVLAKVFMSAMAMNQRLGQVPAQLAQKEAALQGATADLAAAWDKLAADRDFFERKVREQAQRDAGQLDAPEKAMEDAILKATEAELKKLAPPEPKKEASREDETFLGPA